jgi:hypothetical protein
MPKRCREPEEQDLEEVVKRVRVLDSIPDDNTRKRNFEFENAPRKRMRTVEPTPIKYKAYEYRDCIRKLYNMNKRLLHKLEIEKMHVKEAEEKFLHLKNEVKIRGIAAHNWPTFPTSPPLPPVVY